MGDLYFPLMPEIFYTRGEGAFCYSAFLHFRETNYLLSFTQSFSRSALKCTKEDIFAYKPKKPETAFLLYIKSVRPKFVGEEPDIKPSEIVKKASKEWAKLDPIRKEDFKKLYHQNYELYVQQLKEYENSLTEEQRQLLKERKKRHQEGSIDMDSRRKSETFGKPKKPPNGFLLYVSSKKKDKDPHIVPKDWIREVTTSWKKLPDTDKEEYKTRADEMMTQYKQTLEEWEKNMIGLGHPEIVRRKTLHQYNEKKHELQN
ncbi:mitochondrial transcription factor A isoform X2 [Andrena cerasifolii]|uniref:mitochondrial transcription factor A isoform X2 n=1 Tax=Andrena cerasifolii TaxID=2819439 RepID=UPI00403828EB